MSTENDGRNDFDFLIGTWKVHHRMLKARLKGSTEWLEFEGDTVDRKILNGIGNMDGERMARGINLLKEGFQLTTAPTMEQIYDSRFLPPAADRKLS